jgi:catechol 2,3-dioxygenase-like lactoylglutathione lyase family enzyme
MHGLALCLRLFACCWNCVFDLPITNMKNRWLLTRAVCLVVSSTLPQLKPASGEATADARPYWIGLSVPDAEASAIWYREKLHFTIKKRLVLPEHLRIVFLELNGYTIELVESRTATSFETVRKRIPEIRGRDNLHGFFKCGFLVSNVDALAADVKSAGVKLVSGPSDDRAFGVRQFLVEDNAGNVLQFFSTLH